MASEQHWELNRLKLKRHRTWCRSSRVKCPFVKMSASWFLKSTYLIWMLGSGLILSSNQSRATLLVLETCLSVGSPPSMIILIAASLSSRCTTQLTYEKNARLRRQNQHSIIQDVRDMLVCYPLIHLLLWGFAIERGLPVPSWISVFDLKFECHTSITKSQRTSAARRSMRRPASRGISDPVELCDTHVCLLHIQLTGTHVWLPNMHNVPPEVDFESSRSPAKSESWNCARRHCWAVIPTWQYCLYSLVEWMYEIKRAKRLSQSLVHFVIARASLLTDKEYQVYQCVPDVDISWNFDSIHLTILPRISILLLWIDGHQDKVWRLYALLRCFVRWFTTAFHTLFWHDLPYRRTTQRSSIFPSLVVFLFSLRKLRIRTWFCNVQQYPDLFHTVFECNPSKHDQRLMWVLPNQLLYWVFSASDQESVSFPPI